MNLSGRTTLRKVKDETYVAEMERRVAELETALKRIANPAIRSVDYVRNIALAALDRTSPTHEPPEDGAVRGDSQ